MANKEKLATLKNAVKWGERTLQVFLSLCLIPVLLPACSMSYTIGPSTTVEVEASPTHAALPTVTLIPTLAPLPSPTFIPPDPLGTIALDFVALLCNADWMNGAEHLTPCPGDDADHSGGYATRHKAAPREYPADTPILLMVPNATALFLRYPSYKVGAGDRFRTTLLCGTAAPCDVQFALEYYDAQGNYYEFMEWNYKTGDTPIAVDFDLSAIAGQSVDFVLTLRLFHAIESSQHDNGLWVAPHIYRPSP
ncbi:MAG: hypothetical protein EHM33_00570 [Chloroflexi bacterium]|nr:MAG: hypothetical protein EHM33_00570 [Chloroflexota bacterium]